MEKILIIDDEESTRELLKLSLESDGYEVVTAEDGQRGLALYDSTQPEIVLTDIKMPGIDGIEVLRRLKRLNSDVEVIVITGHGQMDLAIQALQLEASDFINKPINDLALSVALRRARERSWTRRKLRDYMTNLECMLKNATEEIKKRHDFEHRLVQTSMDGIIANDPRGNIIIFNEGASRICGYSREEALCSLNVIQLYPPGEARAIKKHIIDDQYGGPGHLINFDTQVLSRDGRLVPVLLSASIIYEDDHEVATVGYFKDLTEIKRLQHKLLEKTRMAVLGEAMAEVAHSIKNILYGMKLGAFMVNDGITKERLEMVCKGWPMVERNMNRISGLSLDMLSYARRERFERMVFQLNEVVDEVCESLAAQAQSQRVAIERDLEPGLPPLTGNPQVIHACILNLVTNALEAFPEDTAKGTVHVRTRPNPDRQVVIEVSDTGKGMSHELQKDIFKPLFTTKRARGTGLGLAITQKAVNEHGGTIEVRSEPQQGATFTVCLPLESNANNASGGPPSAAG